MKKTARRTEFEYRCFPCREQDDKARSYTRSYDLILHMVNTHMKFPTDAKHNAYYKADGSDLRDATPEEKEKYRLAAQHKRKKPEPESPCGKVGNTIAAQENKSKVEEKRNSDQRRRDVENPRDRDERGVHRKGSEDKSGRTPSRDSAKGRGSDHRDRSRTGGSLRDEDNGHEKRTNLSDGKAKGEADGVDDDERDRLEVAEIMRRIEERKAAKQLEASRSSRKEKGRVDTVADVSHGKDKTGSSDVARTTDKIVADAQRMTKKAGAGRITATVSHVTQREAARSWAAEESTDCSTVARSTTEKSSTRSKAVKKNKEAKPTVVNETMESIEAQNFIAAQYPPVDEGVLSATRLGRALVSGALGRCTDDPQMFDAAVGIVECSVVLRTTKVKAKTPVSNPPPNSIDSDVEGASLCWKRDRRCAKYARRSRNASDHRK